MSNVAVSKELATSMPLVHSMIVAQDKYIKTKIKDQKFLDAYNKRMSTFLIESKSGHTFLQFLNYYDVKKFNFKNEDVGFFAKYFKSAEREATQLALDTVGEILQSVQDRFIEGGSRLYEGLLKVDKGIKC